MCGELASCTEFRAILAPFSEVIRKLLLLLLKEWKGRPLHPSLARRHSTNRFLLKRKSLESQ